MNSSYAAHLLKKAEETQLNLLASFFANATVTEAFEIARRMVDPLIHDEEHQDMAAAQILVKIRRAIVAHEL